MEKWLDKLADWGVSAGLKLLYAVIVLVVGLKLSKWIIKLLDKSKGFDKIDPSARSFIRSFLSIVMNVVVIITAAVIIGIPMTSFITLLASAGVAIGLALQGALSNLAGGLMILLFKPFRVGDYIEADGSSGTVRDINVFYTVLITPENKHITLPNGKLTNSQIVNYSSEENRRVDLTFSVGYGSDIDRVKKLLLETASAHPLVLSEPEPMARLNKQNDSSLDFAVRVWCKNADYWDVYFDLNESIKSVLDRNGVQIPFPQLDVHIDR